MKKNIKKNTVKANKRIRSGDNVFVISGNNQGKSGKVISRKGYLLVIQGVNMKKKSQKRQEGSKEGGFITIEMPIHASNVSFCDADNKPVKVKIRFNEKNEKELAYINDGSEVLLRSVK